MSGHNKWSSIKHKKGAADAKRGKLFTRIAREIIVAAREGGADVSSNSRLRSAIQTGRSANMPMTNIEKAIKRGTGELEGVRYDEFTYEGYGQNGVAIFIDVMTDNKNRTVAEVRHCFVKYGGSLAENGAVAWNFTQNGFISIAADGLDEEEFMLEALEAGAEDMQVEDGFFNIITGMTDFHVVLKAIEAAGHPIEKAELTRIPKTLVDADDVAGKLLKLIDGLEDLDDVQKVYSNCNISDEVYEGLA